MLTPATITVNFTANYAGPHRICWRQCGVGSYVCTNIVECAGGGNACSITISVMVDPESCDPICFEGYIQATCNPESSSEGQVPWTATFTPNPVCKLYALRYDPVAPCVNPPQLGPTISVVDMGLNCNGTSRPEVSVYCESEIYLCASSIISNLPVGYTMTLDDGCCYTCDRYNVVVSPNCPSCILDGSAIYYVECGTRELKKIDLSGDQTETNEICAVTGSISLQLTTEATGTITPIAPCT